MEEKSKKPIYKKAWFWVIAATVIVAIAGSAGLKDAKKVGENSDSSSTTSTSETKQEEKTEFAVGDIIAFEGREVTVESVERNWDTGKEYLKAKDGKEYVKINVKIENKSDTELSYSTFDFKIEDANGAIEGAAMTTYTDTEGIGSGELAKGGKKSGSVIFEVPAGSTLKLHYEPSFWSSKKVIVKL